jgi:hypothetical protein
MSPKDADSVRKSEALKNFEGNLDDIMAFLKRLDAGDVWKRANRLQKLVQEATAGLALQKPFVEWADVVTGRRR